MRHKTIIFLISLLLVSGCGPSLLQLRSIQSHTKYIKKDAFCIYSKLNSNAITKQPCRLCAKLIWQSSWDLASGYGEIFCRASFYDYHAILFEVHDVGEATVVKMKVVSHYLKRYKIIANDLFDNTDYSACSDK